MKKVLILGENGQIARLVSEMLLKEENVQVTHYLRNSRRLEISDSSREQIVEGNVLDVKMLTKAMKDQDVVYSNIGSPNIANKTKSIVEAMEAAGVNRGIFISALGIYDEVPGKFGEWNKKMCGSSLPDFRRAANIIESSSLGYTILRGAWFTNKNEVDYELTQKNELFKGTEISRKSLASLVVKLTLSPELEVRRSIGVSKPNTEGDKPAFY
ncbi:SDR family oxidoreductase [Niallia taxi]|uniref:SDR family oxidoreductase n=1 Tax=Niallia taxi TaxID=2499688 RepID=UPI00254D3905|nr:SDR family oxidoreductase [Niallia taxi]MDK8640769.1 SDR family oxidoreductase [Niallia taxi]MED4056587.1 SDR family oxidoreductase [Niallia taxi]MED4118573.1 SDR family oxidoreductase [Niallia taxi]